MSENLSILEICAFCCSLDKPTTAIGDLGLVETAQFVCDLVIEEETDFPLMICDGCELKLEQFRIFKTNARETQKRLKGYRRKVKDEYFDGSTKTQLLEIKILGVNSGDTKRPAEWKYEVQEEIDDQVCEPKRTKITKYDPLYLTNSGGKRKQVVGTSKEPKKPKTEEIVVQPKREYKTKATLQTEPRSIFAGHQCEVCEKIFVSKKRLKEHYSEHLGE